MPTTGWDYLVVAVLGTLVGVGELVSRYRDSPQRAVTNVAACTYLLVNAVATVVALALSRTFSLTFGADNQEQIRLLQMLVAGFGALAFLRSSLLVVRVGSRDVGVGPVSLLQVLLFATDREVDRRRAFERADAVPKAVRDLSYEQVGEALPRYCLSLMQNVSKDEEAELDTRLQQIRSSGMDDALKLNALGLVLMNVVGLDVLTAAAGAAKSTIIHGGVMGDVYPRLRQIMSETQDPDQRTLDVLGLTLYNTWPQVRAWIEEDTRPLEGWTVRLRILDADMLADSGASQWFDAHWKAEVKGMLQVVRDYRTQCKDALAAQNIDLDIWPYRVFPAVHGFRTGSGFHFVSFLRWSDRTEHVAPAQYGYELLPPALDGARSREYKALFDNWLDQADRTAPGTPLT